ncbi:MAG: GntR family transcriptional regulator [Desulfovibrio fairfieldensis]
MNTKENAEQKAYRLIIRDIKLKYQPGDFLLERDLAEHFGVSRTPVTIALNRLVAEGLLQKLPKELFHS